MIQQQWDRVRELFDAAVQMSASERAAYLESACPDDAQLRQDVLNWGAAILFNR